MFGGAHDGIEIRREFLLEDAFAQLYPKGGDGIKDRLRIHFVDRNYIIEEGVDGGGLTKEFITKTTDQIFDPHFAFFTETTDHRIYPNHLAAHSHPNHLALFEFFGMLVGKAIYEGILLKPQFARFFLNKFASNGRNQMDELQSLDPDLYANLMKLKYHEGSDVADWGLTFTVSEDLLGTAIQVPLVRNGENEAVTNENRL